MNASTEAMTQAPVNEVSVAALVAEAPPEQRMDDLTQQLADIQRNELHSLLDRQNALIERLHSLAELDNLQDAERQKAIIEAELGTTREEIQKRTHNVGVMAAELMALYDELGLQAQRVDEDSPEDEERRTAAQQAIQNAMQRVADLRAAVTLAEHEREKAENSWWPIGKKSKIVAAIKEVARANIRVEQAKPAIAESQQAALEVEAQIEVDKADRIRRASLAENFSLIREFTANAVSVLTEDRDKTEARRGVTENALNSALQKKAEVARALDALRDELQTMNRDLERERKALNEIPDQGSEAYANQLKIVSELEQTVTEKSGEELKLNTQSMSLTAAVEANKSSLAGLTVQRDTAEVFIIKLETAEKTASILGHNIDRMIKNTTQETASDALDRANDKMIVGAIELGVRAEVSSAKARNDAIERHKALMTQLTAARGAGDQAVAIEAERYMALDAEIRQGYADRGIDIDMGHLQAAAEAFANRGSAPAANTESVTY